MSENRIIEDISDTARWVAFYRAQETERRDALFRDPYARELAGPRGEEIARRTEWGRESSWAVVVRTAVLDEMLLRSLSGGRIGCVLNLAAGLDTRPYRLDLPVDLRWIEVDLPGIMEYKDRKLAGERPRCDLERVPLDLADARPRGELLDRVEAADRDTLVIAEGLLVYLEPDQVARLSRDLAARTRLRRWLLCLTGPFILERVYRGDLRRDLEAGGSPMRFAPAEGPDFFRPHGWRPAEVRFALEEAGRLGRQPASLHQTWNATPPALRRPLREMSRYVLLEREADPSAGPR